MKAKESLFRKILRILRDPMPIRRKRSRPSKRAFEAKFIKAWKRIKRSGGTLGDYLEFGASGGRTMSAMHNALKLLALKQVRMFGFDSFEGMPDRAAFEDEGRWKPGDYEVSLEETREQLTDVNVNWDNTHLIKGWFEETLNAETAKKFNIQKAGVILIDCCNVSSAKTALTFSRNLIKGQAIIVFANWRKNASFGERRAYSEFLSENKYLKSKELATFKPSGKMFIVKNTHATR